MWFLNVIQQNRRKKERKKERLRKKKKQKQREKWKGTRNESTLGRTILRAIKIDHDYYTKTDHALLPYQPFKK